ncbi:unnamed protein product [Prunus armeniaca]
METGVEPATFNHRLLRSCILSISLLPANMVHQLQGTSLCSYVYSTSSHYSGIVLGNLFRRMTSLWQTENGNRVLEDIKVLENDISVINPVTRERT